MVADALSRKHICNQLLIEEYSQELTVALAKMEIEFRLSSTEANIATMTFHPTLLDQIKEKQKSDAFIVEEARKAEHQRPAGLLKPLDIPDWKWEDICMDFITGLPMTLRKKDAIWVVVDWLTKSAHFIPTNQKYSYDKLAELYLERIVSIHGVQKP